MLWRDEMQGWLVAMGSKNIFELWTNNAPSGHPIIYPLLTYISSIIYDKPLSMQLMQWSLAAICIFMFLRWAPFPKFQKFLFVFGYFPFWEYCLISRHYVVIQLLTFIGILFIAKKKYSFLGMSFLVALLLNTHALAWSIAIGLCAAMINDLNDQKLIRDRFKSFINYFECFISAFLLSVATWLSLNSLFQTSRNIDSTSIDINLRSILVAFGRYLGGSILIIPDSSRWIDLSMATAVSTLFIIFTSIYIRNSRKALVFYLASTFSLLGFNAAIYSGEGSRHFGIYYIIFIASIWLYRSDHSVLQSRPIAKVKAVTLFESNVKSKFSLFLSVILAIHFFAGIHRVFLDMVYPYSASKEVATFIRNSEYVNWPLFGTRDVELSSISGYLEKGIYYPEIERLGTFTEWINRSQTLSRENSLMYIEDYMDKHKDIDSVLAILSRKSRLRFDFRSGDLLQREGISISLVKEFLRSYNKPERYYLYEVRRNLNSLNTQQ